MSMLDDPKFQEASRVFQQAVEQYQKEADELWDNLPYDDQLKLFCAVSKLIFKGEIEEKGTYRHVLYQTFGFGPDAYVPAQCSGYLSIHNAIYDGERIGEIIEDFCTNHMDVSKNDLKEQINAFILKKVY